MKRKFITLAMIGALSFNAVAEELSGDQSDACAAILCLSSGERPGECAAPLARYFGINRKKFQDTVNARKDFLSLCPISTSDPNMDSLENAIANGAGRCDAASLNASQSTVVYVDRCTSGYIGDFCEQVPVTVINPTLPDYCSAYNQHGYTYQVGAATYVGNPMEGGQWVTASK